MTWLTRSWGDCGKPAWPISSSPAGRRFEIGELVEAAGIEPLFPVNTNPMMANDFGFYFVKTFA